MGVRPRLGSEILWCPPDLWKDQEGGTSVLASPTWWVLPSGMRARGLGAPSCSMFHRGL